MKYAKKTKSTVPVYGPDANNAKLKPVKPVGTVTESEAVIKAIDDKHAELNDPTTGVTYNIDRTNPQGAAALQPDPETGAVKFDPTPEAGAKAAGGGPNPMAAGAKVEIDAMEAGNDGTAGEAGTPVEPQASPEPDPLSVPGDTGVAESRKKDDDLLEKMRMIAGLR